MDTSNERRFYPDPCFGNVIVFGNNIVFAIQYGVT